MKLVSARKHRAPDKAFEVGAVVQCSKKAAEGCLSLFDLVVSLGELEKRASVTLCYR